MDTKLVIFMTILLVTWTSGIDDVPEFQYPCYVDVCTFPRQFCNSDERRCSPCSQAICHSPRVPTACRYICIKYNEVTTTPTPTTAQKIKQNDDDGVESISSLHLLMIYSVIATTILIVIISIAIGCYCRRKQLLGFNRDSDRKNTKTQYSRVALDKVVIDAEKIPTQLPHVCPTCGEGCKRPSPETHRTNIGTETAMPELSPPSYQSYDSRQNLGSNSPLIQTPSDSAEKFIATSKSRASGLNEVIVANPSPDGDSMHEKPWTDDAYANPEKQENLMKSILSDTDNTLRKSRNEG